MPYVSRNSAGVIIELHHSPAGAASEWLEADNPEVKEFLHRIGSPLQAKQSLSFTDPEMIRVTEDLIDLLIAKQVFTFTELPLAVQQKLGARKQLRKDMNSLGNLIDNDENIL